MVMSNFYKKNFESVSNSLIFFKFLNYYEIKTKPILTFLFCIIKEKSLYYQKTVHFFVFHFVLFQKQISKS